MGRDEIPKQTLFKFLPAIALALFTMGCQDEFRSAALIETTLKEKGYIPYNPIRANWGPGYVFRGNWSNDGIRVIETVCEQLYPDLALNGSRIILQNTEISSKKDFELSIGLLEDVIGDENSAKLDLSKYKSEKKVKIHWGKLAEYEYTGDIKFPDGVVRPVGKSCAKNIAELKAKGEFENSVWIIVRAVAVENLQYDFSKDSGASIGGQIDLEKLLSASAKANWKITGKSSLRIVEPAYIGHAQPLRLVEWIPTGAVAARPIVEISGEMMPLVPILVGEQ